MDRYKTMNRQEMKIIGDFLTADFTQLNDALKSFHEERERIIFVEVNERRSIFTSKQSLIRERQYKISKSIKLNLEQSLALRRILNQDERYSREASAVSEAARIASVISEATRSKDWIVLKVCEEILNEVVLPIVCRKKLDYILENYNNIFESQLQGDDAESNTLALQELRELQLSYIDLENERLAITEESECVIEGLKCNENYQAVLRQINRLYQITSAIGYEDDRWSGRYADNSSQTEFVLKDMSESTQLEGQSFERK